MWYWVTIVGIVCDIGQTIKDGMSKTPQYKDSIIREIPGKSSLYLNLLIIKNSIKTSVLQKYHEASPCTTKKLKVKAPKPIFLVFGKSYLNKTWSSVLNSTYPLSLIPTPCSLSPSTVPFKKFMWWFFFFSLLLLLLLPSKSKVNSYSLA